MREAQGAVAKALQSSKGLGARLGKLRTVAFRYRSAA